MNYRKNYYDYIEYVKTLKRDKNDGNYYELHHIIPKSLGGGDTKDNLVYLTAREHYLAHYLLCKFTEGKAKRSMVWAFHRMVYSDASRKGYRIIKNSRLYEYVRKELVEYLHSNEFRALLSKSAKGRVWVNNGLETKMIKKELLEEFLLENPNYSLGRLKLNIVKKERAHKKTGPRKPTSIRYWMYREGESKDIMVPLESIPIYEKEGWKRGRLNKQSSRNKTNTKGKIRIIKDGIEKSIFKTDLERYLAEGWVRGRKPVSEETKQKMSQSHNDPNGKYQETVKKIRNGEIVRYHPKNITLYKNGQYITLDTNKIDPTPYLNDGWIKKGKPKSEEWKTKMSISMKGNKNGLKKKP